MEANLEKSGIFPPKATFSVGIMDYYAFILVFEPYASAHDSWSLEKKKCTKYVNDPPQWKRTFLVFLTS